jgi:copper chaperone CopZ
MKFFFLLITITVSLLTEAQVSKVSLQASGLTCSMCSNAINKALKTIDFVSKVDADIKTYTFEISFKTNSIVDFDVIRKKVESAGFTVCAFYANFYFNNVHVNAGEPIVIEDKTFLFVNTKSQLLNGDKQVKIMDKGFVSPKEYKSNNYMVPSLQTYHVTL